MDYSGFSLSNQSPHKERQFLQFIKYILPFLRLSEIVRILFLSRKMVDTSFEVSYILMYMTTNYYLNKVDLDLKTETFFKTLLTKRLRKKMASKIAQLGEAEAKIIMKAIYKIDEMNLVQFPQDMDKRLNGWEITRRGGDGFAIVERKFQDKDVKMLVTSYAMSSLEYSVKYQDFSAHFRESFEKGEAVIRTGALICRGDCSDITGGLIVTFLTEKRQIVSRKEYQKKPGELSVWKWEELVLDFSIDEFKKLKDLNEARITLIIYGKDERFWKGFYGAHFTGMFIRGHYLAKNLNNIRF